MDYINFVSQPAFFSFLLEIDRSIADEAHERPCRHCGGKLDRADFWRSGHGLPSGGNDEHRRRFSLCCRTDGCRKRAMPDSVRFLRGMSYVSIIIVILSALNHGPASKCSASLTAQLKVCRQTVQRWIKWWRDVFGASPLWRCRRGEFMPPLSEDNLPRALLDHHMGKVGAVTREALAALLRFLAPMRPK